MVLKFNRDNDADCLFLALLYMTESYALKKCDITGVKLPNKLQNVNERKKDPMDKHDKGKYISSHLEIKNKVKHLHT